MKCEGCEKETQNRVSRHDDEGDYDYDEIYCDDCRDRLNATGFLHLCSQCRGYCDMVGFDEFGDGDRHRCPSCGFED